MDLLSLGAVDITQFCSKMGGLLQLVGYVLTIFKVAIPLIIIGLGMFGLMLLSALLLFIPLLWIAPYYQAVIAKYYEEVKCNNGEVSCQ